MPGVNRPLFGSDRIWNRLIEFAGVPQSNIVFDGRLVFHRWGTRDFWEMKNAAAHPIPRSVSPQVGLLLLCDASGSPVPQCSDPSLHEWFSHSSTPMLSPNEVAFDDKLHTVNSVFPVVPGETYTLLAACAFNHSEKSSQGMWLAVAKPMTFVAPEPYVRADRPPQKIELAGPAPARPRLKLSADEEWKVLSRFAGKPFGEMQLDVSADDATALKVTLRNNAKTQIRVATWSGEAQFAILVRDSRGRQVPMTEKGKRLFQTGGYLDVRWLAAGQTEAHTLSLRELIRMDEPGDYTVLASLPVVGDVDAVLTAAPIDVRIRPAGSVPRK